MLNTRMDRVREPLSEPVNSCHDAATCGYGGDSDNLDVETVSTKPVMCQSDVTEVRKNFKVLVKDIACDIKDLQKLIYISESDGEKQNALDVLWELERKGAFAFDNVGPLEDLLKKIDRFDLISKYLVPYKVKHGDMTVNGAFSGKKSQAMRRVGSSPIPQQGSPMSTRRRSTPHISHHHEQQLQSLPESLRSEHRPQTKFSVVPEEETTDQYKHSEVFANHGFASLPSDARVVPNSQSWSARSHARTHTGERPDTFTQCEAKKNVAPWKTTSCQQSRDHHAEIHDYPQLSLPSNLSDVYIQHRSGQSAFHRPCTGSGACNTNHTCTDHNKQLQVDDDDSLLEFPLSDAEGTRSLTCSAQSQRFGHDDSGFEGTTSPSASKNTGPLQRSEESHCWDVEHKQLFNGLKKIGKSIKIGKFVFPVNCKYSRNPVISLRAIPRENSQSRHVTLIADLLIPKKCSQRKWLVEYSSHSCILTVKVIDPATNEILGQDTVETKLVGSPGVDDDYHMTMKLSNLLCHDYIVYRNNTKHFKFHANLCLLQYGFKEDATAKDYQTMPNEDHDFEEIGLL